MSHPRSIFITGTDTDVGKTWFTVQLITELREKGVDAVGFKPIECGAERSDSLALLKASGDQHSIEEINPIWFESPVAPMVAAGSQAIDTETIIAAHHHLVTRHELVLVEGAGGWLVPITPTQNMADLAASLSASAIVVALNRLGVINHTLLTKAAIESKACHSIEFVFLNHFDNSTDQEKAIDQSLSSNRNVLEECIAGDCPVFENKEMSKISSYLIGQRPGRQVG